MAHTLTIEIPDEVAQVLETQAQTLQRTPEQFTSDWLKAGYDLGLLDKLIEAPGGMGKTEAALHHYLLNVAREKFALLPEEVLPSLPDAEPTLEMSVSDLLTRIQAFDIMLEIAALSPEERDMLNQSLDEVIAAIERVSKTVRATREAFEEKREAA